MQYKMKKHRVHRATIVFLMLAFATAAILCSVCYAKDKENEMVAADTLLEATTPLALGYHAEPLLVVPEKTALIMPVNEKFVEETAEPVDAIRIYDNISLDEELQRLVWQACEESGCPYELVLSIIFCESSYRNVNGDGGNSIGYMQIQPRWHRARMEKLGVTDLTDPLSNFRVGCDLLAELLEKYSVEDALSVYNTGGTGYRKYANKVLSYMEETFGVNT